MAKIDFTAMKNSRKAAEDQIEDNAREVVKERVETFKEKHMQLRTIERNGQMTIPALEHTNSTCYQCSLVVQ